MDPNQPINPYESPKQASRSNWPLFLAIGLFVIAVAGGGVAFMVWQASKDNFANMNRRPAIDMSRGPVYDRNLQRSEFPVIGELPVNQQAASDQPVYEQPTTDPANSEPAFTYPATSPK